MSTIIDLESHRAARRRKDAELDDDPMIAALDLELAGVVTREDLDRVRAELVAAVEAMEIRVAGFESRVEADVSAMRRRLHRVERLLALRVGVYVSLGAVSILMVLGLGALF